MKHNLENVAETMLIPLWARARETGMEHPIISDKTAVKIIDRIAYDFSQFSNAWMSQVGVAVRTMLLDRATLFFIRNHPDAVVINIGAGLDTRFSRVDNGFIHWYDLDLPESICLRKDFFQESHNYSMIAKSVFDFSWIDDVTVGDRPVLIIAEGVLMYFEKNDVKQLMIKLSERFPKAEMLFEMMTPALTGMSKKHDTVSRMNATFKWGIKSGRDVEAFSSRIQFIQEWNYYDFHKKRWKWMGWAARIPAIKNRYNNRIVHIRFERDKTSNDSDLFSDRVRLK